MSFKSALDFVLQWEGGYSNHPNDRGGETNRGIIKRVYDEYRQSRGLPQQSVKDITDSEVADIYRTNYWAAAHCDDCPEPVDLVLFDCAVNCGPRQAVKWLQRAIGIPADGTFGPVTENRVQTTTFTPAEVANSIIDQRDDFYHQLASADPRQMVFLKGWINRLNALRSEIV